MSLAPEILQRLSLISSVTAALLLFVQGSEPNHLDFFAERVTPILRDHCLRCHNEGKSRGGLSLNSRESIVRGGKSGPAVVAGVGAKSLLLQLVSGQSPKMPKQGAPLTAEQIATLGKWIDRGAPWPEGLTMS